MGRMRTTPHARLAALLAAAALGLAACGGGDPATAPPTAAEGPSAGARAYAQCMREHGVDMPDPRRRQRVIRVIRARAIRRRRCASGRGGVRKDLRGDQAARAERGAAGGVQEAALENARCMREHGIDFPDPTFDANGGAQIRIDKAQRRRPGRPGVQGREGGVPEHDAGLRRRRRWANEAPAIAGGGRRRPRGRGGRRRAGRRRATPPAPRRRRRPRATGTVERRDLVDRDTLDGTLGYAAASHAGRRARPARSPGCAIRAPSSGAGSALYDVDGAPAAWLLYGRLPAWRDFAPGMTDGDDVRQLERNLRALGYDPAGTWPSTTTGLGDDRRGRALAGATAGSSRTARSRRGELVFRPAPRASATARPTVGRPGGARPPIGEALLDTARRSRSSSTPTARSSPREGDARHGRRCRRPHRPRAHHRGRQGRRRSRRRGGDDADDRRSRSRSPGGPRAAGSTRRRSTSASRASARKDVLAVPVKALLARGRAAASPSRSPTARRRLVASTPGLYADGCVEVHGDGLREGHDGGDRASDAVLELRDVRRPIPGGVEALRGVDAARRARASCWRSSGRRARASRRCCTSWARSSGRRAGRSRVGRARRRARCGDRALAALRARHIGFVFQQFFLLDGHDGARQRRRPGCSTGRAARASGAARARAALERVGLGHRLAPPAGAAVRRRAPAGRDRAGAASARPAIVFADEPTGNLDTRTGGEIVDAAARAATPSGATIVVITHDREIAPRCRAGRDARRPDRADTRVRGASGDRASRLLPPTSLRTGCDRAAHAARCAPRCRRSGSRSGSPRWSPCSASRSPRKADLLAAARPARHQPAAGRARASRSSARTPSCPRRRRR